ncbi:MAG: hypothetical protein D6724_10585 [Armatimonadetes bacterium]|nr:MAG: hypothetical protein D6724_10585 [Armatimonadota bacterium]
MTPFLIALMAFTQGEVSSHQSPQVVPDVALTDMSGKTVHLSDFRGKKVVLFTWASW